MELHVKIFSSLLFRKVFLGGLIGLILPLNIFAQEFLKKVTTGFKQGNAKTVAVYFDQYVDLTFLDDSKSYGKKQAEIVLQRFFSKVEPNDFTNQLKGNSNNNNTLYSIGTLITSKGNYKVYLLFIIKNATYYLKEIRIDPEYN